MNRSLQGSSYQGSRRTDSLFNLGLTIFFQVCFSNKLNHNKHRHKNILYLSWTFEKAGMNGILPFHFCCFHQMNFLSSPFQGLLSKFHFDVLFYQTHNYLLYFFFSLEGGGFLFRRRRRFRSLLRILSALSIAFPFFSHFSVNNFCLPCL